MLTFHSPSELVAASVPFLRDGLARGEVVALVCRDALTTLITEALPPHTPVVVLRQSDVYTRAAAAVASYLRMIRRQADQGASRVRLVGEVPFGQDREAWPEWTRFEAAVNVALAPYPLSSVCAYDATSLSPSVLTAAAHTHPYTLASPEVLANPAYVEPDILLRRMAIDHPRAVEQAPPTATLPDLTTVRQLGRLRDGLRAALTDAGISPRMQHDLVSAVHEVAVNGLQHGQPPVNVRLWISSSNVVCAVTDHGNGFDDPVAGYTPAHGTGLWLARQTCDRVETTHDRGGFTVRLIAAPAKCSDE
jgi:anti-sigma regulatory factor (Ser/Thr protein kinase)